MVLAIKCLNICLCGGLVWNKELVVGVMTFVNASQTTQLNSHCKYMGICQLSLIKIELLFTQQEPFIICFACKFKSCICLSSHKQLCDFVKLEKFTDKFCIKVGLGKPYCNLRRSVVLGLKMANDCTSLLSTCCLQVQMTMYKVLDQLEWVNFEVQQPTTKYGIVQYGAIKYTVLRLFTTFHENFVLK